MFCQYPGEILACAEVTGVAMEADGIRFDLTRKKMKNIRITVHSDGSVAVSAPFSAPESLITEFVASKREWILRHVSRIGEKKSEGAASDEDLFVLFGKAYRLTVREGMTMSFDISGADAVLTLPPGTDSVRAEEFTDAWRRGVLKEKIAELLPEWERRTGLYCREWRIKKMKTRWGTCNTAAKRIWFSLMLSEKRTECIEYVILHELLHLEIPNHGAEFKAASDRYMPGWRAIKKSITAPPGRISGEKND